MGHRQVGGGAGDVAQSREGAGGEIILRQNGGHRAWHQRQGGDSLGGDGGENGLREGKAALEHQSGAAADRHDQLVEPIAVRHGQGVENDIVVAGVEIGQHRG